MYSSTARKPKESESIEQVHRSLRSIDWPTQIKHQYAHQHPSVEYGNASFEVTGKEGFGYY